MNRGSAILNFSGDYRFLSNFYICGVVYRNWVYPSAEHAYQAAKSSAPGYKKAIRECSTPGKAKRLGQKAKLSEDWEDIKLTVMEDIIYSKFSNNFELHKWLLQTNNRELIEGNTWGDTFWGVCRGKGDNHLGHILMKIRRELKSEERRTGK